MRKIQRNFKGMEGSAEITLNSTKGLARINFISGESEGTTVTVKLANCPDNLQSGKFFVTLNGEENGIKNFRPISGSFQGKFIKFVSQENQPPAPKTKTGKFGDYQYFIALIRITEPKKFKGIEVPLFLHYKFDADEEGNVAIFGKGQNAETLELFLNAVGCWGEEMKYSENILPKLEKMALKKNTVFSFLMKDGQVRGIVPGFADDETGDDDDFDEDDTPAEVEEDDTDDDAEPVKETADDEWDDDGDEEEETYSPPKKGSKPTAKKKIEDDDDWD